MNSKEKALQVMVAIGTLEAVRSSEEDEKPKSANSLMLKNLIEHCMRVGNRYEIDSFVDNHRQPAIEVLDYIEKKVRQAFNPRRVGRDDKGRFVKLGY